MTASPEDEKHRKSLRRWTIVFGTAVGVILLYAGYRHLLRREVDEALAAVRASPFDIRNGVEAMERTYEEAVADAGRRGTPGRQAG